MGWSVLGMWAGDESSPRAFVEFGEHSIGQSLKCPANAVLTGKRQCQPGGKQCAENQRRGHGKGAPWWKGNKRPEPERGGREKERRCPMAIFALREYAAFSPGI